MRGIVPIRTIMLYNFRPWLFFSALLLVPCIVTGTPAGDEQSETSLPPRPHLDSEMVGSYLLAGINREREQAGMVPLRMDRVLLQAASMQSRSMAEQGRLSHSQNGYPTPADRVAASCPEDRRECVKDYREPKSDGGTAQGCCGENVIQSLAGNFAGVAYYTAVDTTGSHRVFKGKVHWYDEKGLAEDMVRRWMESPSHRKLILDARYRVTGISVAEGKDGNYYAAQLFAPGGKEP